MSKNDEFGLKKWWNENGIWIIIFGSIIKQPSSFVGIKFMS